MKKSCRPHWRNCALEADEEIQNIDAIEDRIAPIDVNTLKIRELISTLELCHHKSERWVSNIIEAIGLGTTDKGLGVRQPGNFHTAEKIWQMACATLSSWCVGPPNTSIDQSIGEVPASELLSGLGKRSPLKEWQVQRVIDKIRSLINWPLSQDDPSTQYVWMLLSAEEYDYGYHHTCPEHYREHPDFWLTTVKTIIHDAENGDEAALSLGIAIDMLWPCHWNFVENLKIVLDAIGGNLHPGKPFAACGRNITLTPTRQRMEAIAETLQVFSEDAVAASLADPQILTLLGEPTEVKKWLASSLSKTIRLQLHPSAAMRNLSALNGPDWIKE